MLDGSDCGDRCQRAPTLALDLEEYKARYQANAERIAKHAPKALILHPGPIIRGLEITSEVADGPQSAIARQVRNGVAIRMALIMRALTSKGRTSTKPGAMMRKRGGR